MNISSLEELSSDEDSIRDDELFSFEDDDSSAKDFFSDSVEDELLGFDEEELFTLEELFAFEDDELLTLDELFLFTDDEDDLLVVVFLDDELWAFEDEYFKLEEDFSCESSIKSPSSSVSASSTLLLQALKKHTVKTMHKNTRWKRTL